MSTFAQIESNLVTEVCVAPSVEWCEQTLGGMWVAAEDGTHIGSYYAAKQFFVPPPYPSWYFDTDALSWVAPVPMPDRPEVCDWDETEQTWVVTPVTNRMYALWLHESIKSDGALYRACSTNDTFMPVPTQSDGEKLVAMFPQTENQRYSGVFRHKALACVDGNFIVTYTHVDDNVKVLSDELIASHPYTSTYTYDELVRNLVEWEWAGVALGNGEWQTSLAGMCLDALGVIRKQRNVILAEQAGPIARFLLPPKVM